MIFDEMLKWRIFQNKEEIKLKKMKMKFVHFLFKTSNSILIKIYFTARKILSQKFQSYLIMEIQFFANIITILYYQALFSLTIKFHIYDFQKNTGGILYFFVNQLEKRNIFLMFQESIN